MIFVGIDWADAPHDVRCVPEDDDTTDSFRIGNDPDGLDELVDRIRQCQSSPEETVHVAFEHTQGLVFQRCLAEGYQVYLLNPQMVARLPGSAPAGSSQNRRPGCPGAAPDHPALPGPV